MGMYLPLMALDNAANDGDAQKYIKGKLGDLASAVTGEGGPKAADAVGTFLQGGPKFNESYSPYQANRAAFDLPNADLRQQQIGNYMSAAQGQQALTLEQAMAEEARRKQLEALAQSQAGMADASGMLRAQATGETTSAAAIQQKQGLEAAIASQMSQAAGARGVSPALAQKYAAQGIAQAQQGAVADAAKLRAQEQAQAQQTYAGLQGDYANTIQGALSGVRGQDLSAAGSNLGAALSQRQLADQAQRFGLTGAMGIDQTQMQGQMSLEQLLTSGYNQGEAARLGIAQQNYQRSLMPYQAGWNALGQAAGSLATAGMA